MFRLENQSPDGMSFPFLDGYLEVLSSGTYLPDEPLKLRLTPTSTSSTPTSNDDLSHPRKMFRYSLTTSPDKIRPGRSHKEFVTYTQNYNDRLIRIRPRPINPGELGDPYRSSNSPFQIFWDLIRRRMAKVQVPLATLPNPNSGYPT